MICRSVLTLIMGSIGMLAGISVHGEGADLFQKLPPGVFVERRVETPVDQREAVGRKLGGKVSELTNAFLRVHGREIQVNVINAADEASATAIYAGLSKAKAPPFCLRHDRTIVEYVGKGLDESIAIKTTYELGLAPRPSRVNYKIRAELATIDRADYMACNPLFNELLSLEGKGGNQGPAPESVTTLANRFRFGRSLALRQPRLNTAGATARYQFEPAAGRTEEKGNLVHYEFGQLPVKYGVPFVTASLEVPVSGTGLLNDPAKPGSALVAATAYWPVNDPEVKALAQEITRGKATAEAKVKSILEWLAPGRNIKYSGETGSRWGVKKVIEQKFGRCWDFSDCFVTLCRASGIPSRQVAGWLYGSSGHVWAEYYKDGQGWQQVDATGGGELPCGIYHIAYFTTEDGEMPIVYLSMPKITIE